jgi:hypothetical protein
LGSRGLPPIGPGFSVGPGFSREFWRYVLFSSIMSPQTAQPSVDLASLYRRAFEVYGAQALWNMRPVSDPTPADALAITRSLRTHGRMEGRRLAERIEELCRADK